jgi:hypothetical protein
VKIQKKKIAYWLSHDLYKEGGNETGNGTMKQSIPPCLYKRKISAMNKNGAAKRARSF